MNLIFLSDLYTRMKRDSVGMIPCTQTEVEELENHFKIKLPRAYREFLLTMGKYFGPNSTGVDCCYDDLFHLLEWAKDLLSFNQIPIMLPSDAFVFSMHQGCNIAFLRLSEGDDPPVYYYNEGDIVETEFKRIYPTFSGYQSAIVYAGLFTFLNREK